MADFSQWSLEMAADRLREALGLWFWMAEDEIPCKGSLATLAKEVPPVAAAAARRVAHHAGHVVWLWGGDPFVPLVGHRHVAHARDTCGGTSLAAGTM